MDAARIIRIVVGTVMVLFGLVGVAVGVIGMIDPVGSKMSDDSDPFGAPPSLIEGLVLTLVFLAITCAGAFLAAYRDKFSNSN